MPIVCKGGQQSNARITFASAPTVGREYVRLVAFLMVNERDFIMRMADISQAFTQSDLYNVEHRVLIMIPEYISMTSAVWNGEMLIDKDKMCVGNSDHKKTMLQQKPANTHGIWLYRPLYGTRDVPMRWYCRISTILAKHSFKPLRSDCCVFSRSRRLKKGGKRVHS